MTKRLQVDWSDWSFGPGRHPVVGACLAGAMALNVTLVGDLSGLLVPWWPLLAGALLALAAAVTAAWQDAPGAAVAYRAGCWLSAGAWSAATLHWWSPWSRWPLLTLATGVAVAAVVGHGLAWLEQRQQPEQPDGDAPSPGLGKLAARWEAKLRQITRRQVTVLGLEWWSPPTGFTLDCRLPGDGTTLADVKAFEAQLASAANLPPGCNVEVLAGDGGRRSFRVRVAVENAMAEIQPIPEDTSALSIEQPLPLGVHADRTEATINLRYACGVLVGQTDSGKSNTLNVITHQLVRCPDVLVWAIDCSGAGRFPRPWVRAWRDGQADRPAIDWAAVTPDEALAMCHAAIAVINGRTAAYERLMHERNVDLIPAGPDLPEIVILADEYADLPEQVKAGLETISNTGRGAAVRVVTCVLRATGQYIPRSMIVQARERIAMRVSDEAELQYLFDAQWGRGRVDPASVPYQGSGLVATGTSPIAPFKAWRLEPARISEASVAVAELRPELDPISAELAGEAYPGRWERMLPIMFPGTAGAVPTAQQPARGGTTTLARPKEETVDLNESAKDLQRKLDAARAAREQADAEHDAEPGEPEPETDWSVVEGWLAEAAPGRQTPAVPARRRMRELVREHRRDGIGPRAVWQTLQAEGHVTVEPTVVTWMRRDAEAGILAQPGGRGTPYIPGPRFTLEQP